MSTSTPRHNASPFGSLVAAVESADVLDAPAQAIGRTVREALPAGGVKDALSGTWLGHPLHPLLTDGVITALLGSSLLDLLGADPGNRVKRKLIGLGAALYLPTALSGINDWADSEATDDGVRRAGLVHAGGNVVALLLYAASVRGRRRRGGGGLLRVLAAGTLTTGGYLGGHLAYAKGVGVDQTAFDPGPEDWTVATSASELPAGGVHRAIVQDTPVLLVRHAEGILAVHDRCSHRGCSLAEGDLSGTEVTCGCHGSRFDLRTGAVLRGPATAPQPAFEVRERDGNVEVRRRQAG